MKMCEFVHIIDIFDILCKVIGRSLQLGEQQRWRKCKLVTTQTEKEEYSSNINWNRQTELKFLIEKTLFLSNFKPEIEA
jgi:hypothetical protein